MSAKTGNEPLPPTVVQVFEEFIENMTSDETIDNDATKRLEKLIHKGDIPKADDIKKTLFELNERHTR